MIPLLSNLRLACGVVADNLADDPFLFVLQASRRLPARLVTPAARLLTGAAPARSASVPVLAAELLNGNNAGLKRRLQLALDRGMSPRKAARLAEIALAANDPDFADRFLAASTGSRGHSAAQARRSWYSGDVTEAVAALDAAAGVRTAPSRQRARLASEQAVLRGWAPQLPGTPVEPVPNRVLHLLTNSLPHTQSGYAQRSHSTLMAQQDAGWETLSVTRLGYPVLVGKLNAAAEDLVDGVRYKRLLPARLATTPSGRLQQQAEETLRLASRFRPSVIHTTTHHVNGLVARALAESLGAPVGLRGPGTAGRYVGVHQGRGRQTERTLQTVPEPRG